MLSYIYISFFCIFDFSQSFYFIFFFFLLALLTFRNCYLHNFCKGIQKNASRYFDIIPYFFFTVPCATQENFALSRRDVLLLSLSLCVCVCVDHVVRSRDNKRRKFKAELIF